MTLMTDQDMDNLAVHLPLVKAWANAVEAELQRRMENGSQFKNCRLVPKRANRAWAAGIDVLKLLRKFSKLDVVAPRVPLSPSQAEKTLGRKVYADHLAESVSRESSGMKVAFGAED